MENGIFVIVVLTCTDTLNEPNSKLDLKNINTFLDHSQVEENHGGVSRNTHSDNQMLYTPVDRPRGHGECGGST